jgi:dihydroneopterin aldolase
MRLGTGERRIKAWTKSGRWLLDALSTYYASGISHHRSPSSFFRPDQWHRTRPQPIQVSLHLHLAPLYLDTPGRSDDVADSLHYGHLAKAVERRVDARDADGYASARALVEDVTDAAFGFARDAVGRDADAVGGVVHAVRVVLSLPKQILLAGGFEVELIMRASDWTPPSGAPNTSSKAGAIVRVTDPVLPVLIGVNPPERLAKQRLVTDLTFFEAARTSVEGGEVDYPAIVRQIATASHSCPKVVRPTLIDD